MSILFIIYKNAFDFDWSYDTTEIAFFSCMNILQYTYGAIFFLHFLSKIIFVNKMSLQSFKIL